MSTKLHEILAVEADRESAATAILAETSNTLSKKPDHFTGKHTKYTPFSETAMDGEESSKEIVTTVRDKLTHCFSICGRAIDITATKDAANCEAKAAIEIDGETITPELPATTLLMLENRLKKWIEVLLVVPTLAPGRDWRPDTTKGNGVFLDHSPDVKFRTKKDFAHKVLVEASGQHPAQIEKWTEDVKIGKITETTWSSMVTPGEKSALLERAQNLLAATKQARQRANAQEVTQVTVADALSSYILG